MISVRNLTKTYQKGRESIVLLDDADFDVAAGEFVMILGESGSGKTTLLNFLGALDRPDRGEIHIDGVGDLLVISDKELAKYRNRVVGHIFQTFNLKPTYTASENVRVPLLFTTADREQQDARIEESLKAVGLWERRLFKPIELSEGQCQRVAIARAIVNKPRILLADEPTGNLDPKTAASVMDLLIRLNDELGITLVMVTHDLDVLQHADKVFTIADGKLTGNGATATDPVQEDSGTDAQGGR